VIKRARQALALAALVPLLGGAICGDIYVDFTQRTLVVDDVAAIDIDIDRGGAEIFAFDRNGVVLSKYVSSWEDTLGDNGFRVVENGDGTETLEIVSECVKDRKCAVQWYAEISLGTAVTVRLADGPLKITGVDAPIDIEASAGFEGVGLRALDVDVLVEQGDVAIELVTVPERVAIEIGEGDVALTIPPGTYRCELATAMGDVSTGDVVCDDTATATLAIAIATEGNIDVRHAE
jgi:hypothetical protein